MALIETTPKSIILLFREFEEKILAKAINVTIFRDEKHNKYTNMVNPEHEMSLTCNQVP